MSTLELVEKGELPDPVPDADRWDEVYLGDFDLSRPAYAAKAEGWVVTGTSGSLSPAWATHYALTIMTVAVRYLRLHSYQSFRVAAQGAQGICC